MVVETASVKIEKRVLNRVRKYVKKNKTLKIGGLISKCITDFLDKEDAAVKEHNREERETIIGDNKG